ncbi:efflux RND transporter permease subunit [Clostridium boliviensis]|uniref:Efflux RND transporter permease subunit n=1 Tax=Clostridium boliviensis TaxID=318465 RepID=A0ABU4GR00_9CLOT|nr:efflux RND transporter permease subunit [Clostridium boliviensis]MDW2799410.1 efflux RND transporter permease subunit [Clostridium boliviensis]
MRTVKTKEKMKQHHGSMPKKRHSGLIELIVKNGRRIEKIFALVVVISAICTCFVHVNYDLSEYLPDWAPAKKGLNVMEEQFGYPGTARVMVGPVTLYEAKAYKDRIADIDGVDMVMWADTTTDVYKANIFINYDDIQDYYKDNYAVMDIIFKEGDSSSLTKSAINQMQKLTGDKGFFMGSAVQNKSLNETLTREISIAMAMGVVMIALVLCITTTSWFEPFLFLMIMGIAIIINMGSNLAIGTISFITFSVASILQLAVAMDYSVFLLDSFTKEREKGDDPVTAITNALHKALPSILASGATTIIGFLVLMLMRFSIGRDLGFVLAKGIVISLVTVLFLMPSLLLRWGDRIKKTEHRSFMPSFHGLGILVHKVRYGVLTGIAVLIIPAFVAQSMNAFTFGNSALGSSPGTRVYNDEQQINSRFGKSNLILAVVPNTNMVTEKNLTDSLKDLNYVRSVTSLAGTLPEGIPEKILPKSLTSLMHTKDYSRIMIYVKSSDESDFAYQCSDEISALVNQYYPEGAYITGVIPSTQNIQTIITQDYNFVNILSILGVGLVVMLTFRSVIIPVVVLIPIEVAVFFNFAIPYFTGEKILYLGYIIVSCLQLGATVDYSILMTNNYIDMKKKYPEKARAIKHTVSKSALSILTSGTILTIVGYGLYFVSSVSAIAGLGHLIGRGAFISVIMVLFLLPVLLTLADPVLMWEEGKRQKIAAAHLAMVEKKKAFKTAVMEKKKERLEKRKESAVDQKGAQNKTTEDKKQDKEEVKTNEE